MKKFFKILFYLIILMILFNMCSGGNDEIKKEETEYRKGVLYKKDGKSPYDGIVKDYYQNGNLKSEFKYKDGINLDGYYKIYNKNGNLESEKYEDGNYWIYKEYRDNKLLIEEKENRGTNLFEVKKYDKNGNLILKEEIKDNRLMNSASYYPNSNNIKEKYLYYEGRLSAIMEYYPNKQLKSTGSWSNIYRNYEGKYEEYYSNGKLKEILFYQDGMRHGEFKQYYENGQLESYGYYRNDELDGTIYYYYDNGQPWKMVQYKNGRAVSSFDL